MATDGAKLATGWLELTVSTKGAQRQIAEDIGGSGEQAGKKFSLGFAAVAGAVGGVVATIASAAIGSVGALVGEAVRASDATDKFKQTLNFAGVDAGGIDALAKSTRAYADQTVYSLGDIQNITAQLAANGVPNYDKLAEAAGNLNAVAGGNADTFSSVGMVLTQTAGAGKLTTENWNQLADAIPGASGMLQKALADAGAYTGNFRDAMQQGQISADEFNTALMTLGMTDAAKEAATSTATIEGAVGNLQASVVGLLSDGVGLIKPFLTGAINGVATFISGIGPALSGIGSLVSGAFSAVGPMFAQLGPIFTGLLPQLLTLWQSLSPVSLIFNALLPVLPQIMGVFAQLGVTIGGALGQALQVIVPVIANLASLLVGSLGQAITALVPVIVQLAGMLGSLLTGVITTLMPVVASLVSMLGPILGTVIQALVPVVTLLATVIGQVLTAVAPLIPAVFQLITPILGLIAPIVQLVGALLPPLIQLFTAFLGPILGLVQPILGLLVPALQFIATVLGTVINWVVQAIQWFVNFVTGQQEAGAQFQAVWSGIMGFFGGIGRFFASIWNGLIGGIAGFIGQVVGYFQSIPDTIMGVFAGAGQWLYNVGRDIVNGLLNGVGSLLRNIGQFFLNMVPGWILGPFKAALGIASPSKVFRQYGVWTMEGYIDGIDQMQSSVAGTLSDAVTMPAVPVMGAGAAGTSRAGATVNQYITTQQTDPRIQVRQWGREAERAFAAT